MAEIIYCPCGQAFECGRTDVLESVDCPACRRELALDVSHNGGRGRAFLTVVSGPDRVGERILMPVGFELTIGRGDDNWLSLLHESVAPRQCVLVLDPSGKLAAHGGGSAPGTASVRGAVIAEIRPNQALRIGQFQLKFSVESVAEAAARAMAPVARSSAGPVEKSPMLTRVRSGPPWLRKLASKRFQFARLGMFLTAALLGYLEAMILWGPTRAERYKTAGMIVVIVSIFVVVGNRIQLTARRWNLAAIGLLVAVAAMEAVGRQPVAFIALLILAAALILLIERPREPAAAAAGLALLSLGVVTLLVAIYLVATPYHAAMHG